MAGRLKRHRGGPPRAAAPPDGVLRRATVGESTAASITRSTLIEIFRGAVIVWVPSEPGGHRYERIWSPEIEKALLEYWRGSAK